MYVLLYVCMYVYVFVYVCMCMCSRARMHVCAHARVCAMAASWVHLGQPHSGIEYTLRAFKLNSVLFLFVLNFGKVPILCQLRVCGRVFSEPLKSAKIGIFTPLTISLSRTYITAFAYYWLLLFVCLCMYYYIILYIVFIIYLLLVYVV